MQVQAVSCVALRFTSLCCGYTSTWQDACFEKRTGPPRYESNGVILRSVAPCVQRWAWIFVQAYSTGAYNVVLCEVVSHRGSPPVLKSEQGCTCTKETKNAI